jgi:hypothetical protein
MHFLPPRIFSDFSSLSIYFSYARKQISGLFVWKIRCHVGPTCWPHFLIVHGPACQNPSPTWRPCGGAVEPRGVVALSSRSGRLSLVRATAPRIAIAARLLPALCNGALSVTSASLPLHSQSQVPTPVERRPSCTSSRELTAVPFRRCQAVHNVFTSPVGCCHSDIAECSRARLLHHWQYFLPRNELSRAATF